MAKCRPLSGWFILHCTFHWKIKKEPEMRQKQKSDIDFYNWLPTILQPLFFSSNLFVNTILSICTHIIYHQIFHCVYFFLCSVCPINFSDDVLSPITNAATFIRGSVADTNTKTDDDYESIELHTLNMTGFSSSLSIGMAVEWTQVEVQRCRRRT